MSNYKTVENGLIPIMENETGDRLVDARQLHEFVESKQDFSDWIKKRTEDVDAIEDEDFTIILGKSNGGRPSKEYVINLDIAKEIAMLEKNEKGKQIRRYFITIEKKHRQNKLDLMEHLKLEQQGLKFAIDLIKPSQSSTIKMLRDFNESQGLTTVYLPIYVDEQVGISATTLLKEFEVKLSAVKFNELLIKHEILEVQQRKSTSNLNGIKTFKVLTEKGLYYGKNEISTKGSGKESQPLYYRSKFQELINLVGCEVTTC